MSEIIDLFGERSEDEDENYQEEEHAEYSAFESVSYEIQSYPVDDDVAQNDADHAMERGGRSCFDSCVIAVYCEAENVASDSAD